MLQLLKQQQDSFLFKVLLLGAFLIALFLSNPVKAESVNSLIYSANNIQSNAEGAQFLPVSVLQSMTSGQVSPVGQFVVLRNLMIQAVRKSTQEGPGDRTPYAIAKEKFDWGLCNVTKAFQNALVVSLLPQMSAIRQNGGSNDPGVRQAKQQQALAMAQAFAGVEGCDHDGNDTGFDSNILNAIQNAL